MQNRTENSGAQLLCHDPPVSPFFKKGITYLAKIAVILQDAPRKMLTFAQLMNKMAPLISDDRKSVENNIRVCLSTNKCFVKIPMVPFSQDSKRNYWKLDYSQITAKMVRRHFKGILHLFPELASKTETENLNRPSVRQPAASRALQVRYEVKFNSPFSIESLLKRDSPSAWPATASPPSAVMPRAEQYLWSAGTRRSFSWDSEESFLLPTPAGSSSICSAGGSTYHGATAAGAAGAAEPFRRMSVYAEPSFPVYTGAAPYYNSQDSSYMAYSAPAFTHDALRFWL